MDEYDLDGAEWVSTQFIGSIYEIEIAVNRRDTYRHRENFNGRVGPWLKGQPDQSPKELN